MPPSTASQIRDKKIEVQRDVRNVWVRKYGHGMVGGTATRQRLAADNPPTLGKWEQVDMVRGRIDLDCWRQLIRCLPPECLSPSFFRFDQIGKIRAHRPDIRLSTIVEAAKIDGFKYALWKDVEPLLDLPKDEIMDLLTMNRLRRLVGE